ncbi:MAG TPA: response regulator [Blastocatellia bacterium]|nr:response regulator [Blastocatellia bacterium]HMX28113.1 response regulator [Blastocatellia bacterium]HMY74404.1 response regulator [Blastocatellia bacterium]HMZ20201.1 response regulator [Blastocatellia bacterium]HNG34190.1 response regulator [Blastocatellia bacterium]
MKVLIVEEHAAMRRLLRSLFEELPCTVCECGDGAQALAMCLTQQPDWVLLDFNQRHPDALETTRQIHLACPQARVVLVGNDDEMRLRQAAECAGASDYVLKEDLLNVRHLLTGQTASPR